MQAEESMASLRTKQPVEDVACAEVHLASNTPKSISLDPVASDADANLDAAVCPQYPNDVIAMDILHCYATYCEPSSP